MAFGGYVRSVNSYSAGASAVILPHIVGALRSRARATTSPGIRVAEHTDTGAGLRRHGAEELRMSPAAASAGTSSATRCRSARAAAPSSLHRAVARRHAGSSRRPVAADPSRHRRGADAGARAHACWSKICGTAPLSRAIAPASTSSSAICSAATTVRQRTRHGRPILPAFAAAAIVDLARRLPRGAHLDHGLAFAAARANMASSRCGWARCSRPCSARSACRAADTITRSARSAHTGRRPSAVPIPTLPQGKNGISRFHPGGARRRHAAASGRAVRLQRPARCNTLISSWSIGRAATRSTITRTSTGCGAPSHVPHTVVVHETRLDADGDVTPTSCCRRP